MASVKPRDEDDDFLLWRARVQSVQRSRASPETLAQIKLRSDQKERAKKSVVRAKRLQTVQAYSKSSFGGSMAGMRSAPTAPSCGGGGTPFGGVGAHLTAASPTSSFAFLGEAPKNKEDVAQQAQLSSAAMSTLQRAASCSDDEEAEVAIESARLQLEQAGHSWAARGAAGACETADLLGDAGSESSVGGVMADLMRDLQVEPADDADAARRFAMYEAHAETIASVRKSLLSFWATAQVDVPPGLPKQAIESSLAAIDRQENLEIYEEQRYWFVYSMAKKVSANEAQLEAVLRAIQAKLEVLANVDDCPICLEPIDMENNGGLALGCAHKIHADCWGYWGAHCAQQRKTPFCPLCRNDEFLEDVLAPDVRT